MSTCSRVKPGSSASSSGTETVKRRLTSGSAILPARTAEGAVSRHPGDHALARVDDAQVVEAGDVDPVADELRQLLAASPPRRLRPSPRSAAAPSGAASSAVRGRSSLATVAGASCRRAVPDDAGEHAVLDELGRAASAFPRSRRPSAARAGRARRRRARSARRRPSARAFRARSCAPRAARARRRRRTRSRRAARRRQARSSTAGYEPGSSVTAPRVSAAFSTASTAAAGRVDRPPSAPASAARRSRRLRRPRPAARHAGVGHRLLDRRPRRRGIATSSVTPLVKKP